MKQDSDILSKIGKDAGFRVPDGYFEEFSQKMAASLPERKFKAAPKPTMWIRLRPFVYMAAMFAGVWCMVKIFTDMKKASNNYNAEIATAMSDDKFVNDYMMLGNITDYDLLEELYNEGVDASVFDTDTVTQ